MGEYFETAIAKQRQLNVQKYTSFQGDLYKLTATRIKIQMITLVCLSKTMSVFNCKRMQHEETEMSVP